MLDGFAEINFTHRSHIWQPCRLSTFTAQPLQHLSDEGFWIVNQALLDGIFQICSSLQPPATLEADLSGGSCNFISPTASAVDLPALPDAHGDGDAETNGEVLQPVPIQTRISWFECVCCDFKGLLCICPDLWCLLPSPFSSLERDCEWRTAMSKARATLSKIVSFLSHQLPIVGTDALARVDKRLRVYIHYLRKHTANILKDPDSVRQVLNPCDINIAKRPWEFNLLTMRRRWSSLACVNVEQDMGDDLNGGAWHDVEVTSALSGNTILRFSVPFDLENDHSFVDLVLEKAAASFSAPYFCFDVMHAGILLDARLTWEDLGFPKQVQLVCRPKSLEWTEDLFEAVEAGSVQQVQDVLCMGQDPDCTMVDSALCTAIQHNHYPVVRILIKARADVNYIPLGRPGPLQTAVIHDAEACATLLLRRKADPNLPDRTRATNTPLHLAAVYGDAIFSDMLLSNGANPLAKNAFESSPFTLATPGLVTSLCLMKCFHEVDTSAILHRHAIVLQRFGCFPSLWNTCRALRAMKPHSDLEGGSSSRSSSTGADVKSSNCFSDSLASLDSTRWMRTCQNRAKALERKRKASDCLEEFDQATLLARGMTPSEIEMMSTRRRDAIEKNRWHQIWERSMPTCLNQRFRPVAGLAKGIRLPLPVEGWLPSDLGCMPPDFLETGILGATPAFNLLKYSHPHQRDDRLKFDEPSHTYYVDGIPVDCSVTQFLSAFQKPFDADSVISRMEQTAWPRPQYLTFMHLRKAIQFVQGFPFLQPLLSLLQAHPIDETSVCEILQQAPTHESWDGARYLLTMTRDEIKACWKRNGEVASRRGTWAHLQCECILNAGQVRSPGPEMLCLSQFLQTSERLIAYRSEWCIWATEENLAGSIDFCATDPAGCLVLIDWKRSKNLKTKYFSFFNTMKGELSHIPDAVGWKYRLQLNLYKYILEKYYGFSVSRMLVVDIHPDSASNPFIDDVPDMQAEVRSILTTRKRNLQSASASDIQGGSSLNMSQGPTQEEETAEDMELALRMLGPSAPGPNKDCEEKNGPLDVPVKKENQEEEEDLDDALLEGETISKIKRRRLMKGALQSADDFGDMFQGYEDIARSRLTNLAPDLADGQHCMLSRSAELWATVRAQKPLWSDDMVRLGAAVIAVCNMRLSERMFVGDSAFLLWMIEGNKTIRVHSGFCYIYNDDGAFLPYTGTPPEAVLTRVNLFCAILEGALKRLPSTLRRKDCDILRAIGCDRDTFETDSGYFLACRDEAIMGSRKGFAFGVEQDQEGMDAVDEGAPGEGAGSESWATNVAKRMGRMCHSLRSELMHEKLVSLLVEWCETPRAESSCVAYKDTCVAYLPDSSDIDSKGPVLRHVRKSPSNNCYLYIPHSLLDPVEGSNCEKLIKFYSRTFWANKDVFLCCQAALALAKRGFNVDRCFIGESPGGVGQSLYSLHLDTMLAQNHAFFDPNVWYNEDELRKQVETFARCVVITGQEAPESAKKLHLDLFKKTMSGDGVAGRKPYGFTTRMFQLIGWKRLEVNRMLKFAGVTPANFNSIFRRGFYWQAKARFHPPHVIARLHPDHELDGHFEADPTLKQFLSGAPAAAAGLRIQHAFEAVTGQQDCIDLIENYVAGGDESLTEDKMRAACGLPIRERRQEVDAVAAAMVHIPDSQEDRAAEEKKWIQLRNLIVKSLLERGLSTITHAIFQKMPFSCEEVPNHSKADLWKGLVERKLLVKGAAPCRGRASVQMQPVLQTDTSFFKAVDCKKDCQGQVFVESVSTESVRTIVEKGIGLQNMDILLRFFQQKAKDKVQKRGPGRATVQTEELRAKFDKLAQKVKEQQRACESLGKLGLAASTATSPVRKMSTKTTPCTSYEVTYRYVGDRPSRDRQYANKFAAQACSRRLQEFLFPHTIDLDIQSCSLTILLQIYEKLLPQPPLPEPALDFLRRCVRDRNSVCSAELKVAVLEGKELINSVLHGLALPATFKDCPAAKQLQQVSLYMRWLACSVFPDEFRELREKGEKRNPDATVLFFMWTAVEDYVLSSWVSKVRQCNDNNLPAHLSLHFDGIRLNSDLKALANREQFLKDCAHHIQEQTGFNVTILQKKHLVFLQLLKEASSKSSDLTNVPQALLQRGNSIVCACWHLVDSSEKDQVLESLAGCSQENTFSEDRGVRTYKQMSQKLVPHYGLPPVEAHKFLLHLDFNFRPHCVAVVFNREAGEVNVFDGAKLHCLSLQAFTEAYSVAIDRLMVASFIVKAEVAAEEVTADEEILLDLEAGSDGSDIEDTLPEAQFLVDEEGVVYFKDNILEALEEERNEFLQEVQDCTTRHSKRRHCCALCPFRSFTERRKLLQHVRAHHKKENQFVCSGTKQVKIILSLHDADSARRNMQFSYLQRSAAYIRTQVQPPLSCKHNEVDRHIRLVLTAGGPTYCNENALGVTVFARRVRNIFYDQSFAEVLFRELLLHHANVSWTRLLETVFADQDSFI